MTKYYFVGTLLPELNIDVPPEIGFKELDVLLRDNLSIEDYAKTSVVRNFYDIFNLRSYWKGEPLDPFGSLDERDLVEALVTRSMLPPFIFEYLDKYENNEDRLLHFSELLVRFFNEEIKNATGVFKEYLMLERELRLILVAIRSKKLGRDVVKELQYEDPEDEIVAQIIAQKDASVYEPPEKYEDFKPIITQFYDDPIALQKAFYEYRFRKIQDLIGIDLFSIDRILAYMVEVIMIEKWQHLNKEKGLEIVDSMLKEPS